MAFYVGQKVVCVDASATLNGASVPLREGSIYTVSGLDADGPPSQLALYLQEIGKTEVLTGMFYAHRFRPVVERPTDISIFKAMLNPKTAEIDA